MSKRTLPTYVDAATCTACGGACCKRSPGVTAPEDWGAPHRMIMRIRLAEAFRSGNYAIDWWTKDRDMPQTLFVRPATVHGKDMGHLRDGSWGGQCALLTDSGCPLGHDERPFECRMLEPNKVGVEEHCHAHVDRFDIIKLWRDYQDVIEAAEAAVAA